jgi:hypothetical protein
MKQKQLIYSVRNGIATNHVEHESSSARVFSYTENCKRIPKGERNWRFKEFYANKTGEHYSGERSERRKLEIKKNRTFISPQKYASIFAMGIELAMCLVTIKQLKA